MLKRPHWTLAILLLGILLPGAAFAQSTIAWSKHPMTGPPARIEVTLVYDSVAQRMIAFGGFDLNWYRLQDIWEYDGSAKTWTNVTPASGALPPRRSGHAMAFDPVRRVVVLFGGYNEDLLYLNDTWEWDTVARTWTKLTPLTSPQRRQGARLVYDSNASRMVLVGGVDASQFWNDTWTWNPATRAWSIIATTTSSAAGRIYHARAYPGAAFNPTGGRGVTVFGGIGYAVVEPVIAFNDVWELRGTVWTDVTPSGVSPPARAWTQLAWDSALNRMIMFAGYPITYGDTWQLVNDTWSQIVTEQASPAGRDSHGMVYDSARQKVVVFGGYLADVIELTANTWAQAQRIDWAPAQAHHVMAYDTHRDRLFVYGGSVETWEYVPATSLWEWFYTLGPNGRAGAAAVYDQVRRRMLLFGGRASSSGVVGATLGDTWEQDTVTKVWTAHTSGVAPPARDDHAMVYDTAHNRTILFGGRNEAGQVLADTWLWAGNGWVDVTSTAQGPSARYGHAMTYDAVRGVAVLVGGHNGSVPLNDVWEWDGVQERWHQVISSGATPAARSFAALSAFDSATGGVVLFGGTTDGNTLSNDAWIWTGSAWTRAFASGIAPAPRTMVGMVYAPTSGRVWLYGGRDASGKSPDLFSATLSIGSGPGAGPVPNDINGDGFADLIWHNTATGANVVWYLNGTTVLGQVSLPMAMDPTWQLVASGDINEDGHLDLIWRNTMSGANVVWYLNGTTLLSQASFASVADPTWQIVAVADINGDGHADLLWRNITSGANIVWYLNGTTLLGQANFPTVPDRTWQLVASADMNRDGAADLIWRNSRSGANLVWYMAGATVLGQASFPSAGPAWRLVAAVDVDKDGWPDLIWRDTVSGTNVVWFLSNTALLGHGNLTSVADQTWQLLGATLPDVPMDVNGDRHPDLIWRNKATGSNLIWYLNGSTLLGQADLPEVTDLTWQIVAKADVNGDAHPDLIWRNTTTGANLVWYLNEWTLLGQASLPSVADANWRIVAAVDVNADTHVDLLWRNVSTGANIVWYLNGVTLLSQVNLPTASDLTWEVAAVADVNGDTHPDLVWRNTVSGANVVWYLTGPAFLAQVSLPTVADTTWRIVAAADVNGDGHPDLFWRNTTTGANVVWYLNGTTLVSQANLPTVSDTNWTLRPGG
jgi:hypothetical protein